jgi:hypothetical protein
MSLKITKGENTEKPPSAPAPTPTPPKTKAPKRSNVFTPTSGVVANQGEHWATVIFTEHVGEKVTKRYGVKNWQMFHLRIKQTNAKGVEETAIIHQQFHRSIHSTAALPRFLAGFGIVLQAGVDFDFDDLIGRRVRGVVMHSPGANGQVHANFQALPYVPGLKPQDDVKVTIPKEPEPKPEPVLESESSEPKTDYRRQRISELRGYGASGNDPDGHFARKADEIERQIKAEGTCEN